MPSYKKMITVPDDQAAYLPSEPCLQRSQRQAPPARFFKERARNEGCRELNYDDGQHKHLQSIRSGPDEPEYWFLAQGPVPPIARCGRARLATKERHGHGLTGSVALNRGDVIPLRLYPGFISLFAKSKGASSNARLLFQRPDSRRANRQVADPLLFPRPIHHETVLSEQGPSAIRHEGALFASSVSI